MNKIAFFLILLAISFSGCKKCKKESPRARVINSGTKSVSVQVKTSGGNTENINNIAPGSMSDYRSYAPGIITYTITVDNKDSFVSTVPMGECYEYDIVIDAQNNIISTPRDRNEK